jgi:hypothetical protein
MFKNMVLRRMFRPRRDEVMEGWRTLLNEELHNLYSLPSIVRIIEPKRMNWAWHVACMREKKKNEYRLLVRNLEGKGCRWVANIKMDLVQIGWGAIYWINLTQDKY